MDYKQTLSNQRAELLEAFMERNGLEMEDLERGAHILREIRRARERPISTQSIKLDDIGAAVMPFTHYPIEIPQEGWSQLL